MRIVPTKIRSGGVMNDAFLELLFNNMRERNERLGDFNAMLGTGRKAAEHIGRLFERFGGRGLLEGIDELMERSEGLLRARIAECPDGDYFADGYIESDGTNPEPLVVRLKLTVAGDTITADFTGTSAQTNGPTNCGPAMALNGVGTVVKTFLDPETPINHGSFNPITVIAPERSIINARETSPCGGMAEVKFLIDAVVASAMSQVVPEMSVGDLKGGANHIHIAGPSADGRGHLDPLRMAGRRHRRVGRASTATTAAAATTRATSTRSSRSRPSRAPSRCSVERCELRQGCCGDGAFRGGFGLRRDIRVLDGGAMLSVLSEKNVIPPLRRRGRPRAGASNRFFVHARRRDGWNPPSMPGKVSGFPARGGRRRARGDRGRGRPRRSADPRPRTGAGQDVVEDYLTAGQAERRYGVVLGLRARAVDAEATRSQAGRAARGSGRPVPIEAANEEMFDGTRRRIVVSSEIARSAGIADGALVEVTTGRGAPLRAWAQLADEGSSLLAGASSLAIVRASPGDTVEIAPRPLDSGTVREPDEG